MAYRVRPLARESATASAAPPVIAVVTRVVDGNTLDVVASRDGRRAQWRVRVRGVVVPRLTSKSRTERYVAHAAFEYVRGLIHGRTVVLAHQGYDRFGRSVATVHLPHAHVGQILLHKRMSLPYVRGRIPHVRDWILYYYNGTR